MSWGPKIVDLPDDPTYGGNANGHPGEFYVPQLALAQLDAWGYGTISYSGSGLYSSCDGSYAMYFDISIGAFGNQGTFAFNFTRNP
ncbi:MAG: hypothetical protein NTV31_03135 [Bacteroidia bacterium]|nr:hypothetical protein [Bacteroidia bacterium]